MLTTEVLEQVIRINVVKDRGQEKPVINSVVFLGGLYSIISRAVIIVELILLWIHYALILKRSTV